MIYLITYDLNKNDKDYSNLYLALRQYDYIRDTGLDSVWFVSTTWSVNQVYEHIRVYFDINDRVFVTQITQNTHQGWMNKGIWNWINARL